MALVKFGAIMSASAVAGITLFGVTAYLVLSFGPDLDAARIGF